MRPGAEQQHARQAAAAQLDQALAEIGEHLRRAHQAVVEVLAREPLLVDFTYGRVQLRHLGQGLAAQARTLGELRHVVRRRATGRAATRGRPR